MGKKKTIKVLDWLNTGIFPASILFSSGFSFKELCEELKAQNAVDWLEGISGDEEKFTNANVAGFAAQRVLRRKDGKTKSFLYLIFPREFNFTDREYCILAHEILHICQFYLPDLLDRDSETEAEAYLHTHIMEQCLTVLRNKPDEVEN